MKVPELTGAMRRELKGRAQRLEPVVFVGKAGVSAEVLGALDEALKDHGLVKVRFAAFKDERRAMSERLAEESGAALVTVLGHVAVFYRPREGAGRSGSPV